MADDEDFRYTGLVEWHPGQPVEEFAQAVTRETVGPRRPVWYRDPRVLVGLIVAALAVLVVASVVLLASGQLGEPTDGTDMTLRPTIRTSSIIAPPSSSPPASTSQSPATPSTSATPPTSETSSGEPPVGAEPAPAQPEPATAEPPVARDTQEGPRTNVTRNPMSFTPGQRAGG